MSRQAQNILTGAVACVVAVIAVITVALALRSENGQTTSAAEPLADGLSEAVGTEPDENGQAGDAQSSLGASPTSPSALAVTATEDPAGSGTTIAATATTAPTTPPTTVTVATTAATTATTAAPATSAPADNTTTSATTSTSGSTDTTAEGTTTTQDSQSSTTQAPDSSTTTTAATTTTSAPGTTAPPSGGMNAIEREIARLTNELRTNPNGPLKREGPAIDCNGRVRVDLSTGQYESIGALTVSETASLQVARPWSAQMSRNNFEHQPNAGVGALQAAGISVRSAGENIAYHNYPDKAMFHFTGWRESDGHFCNLMNSGFTHIGVGEVTKSDGISYATQNFYSTG